MSLLVAEGIRKSYRAGRADVPALRHLDLKVEAGEFLAIMGPSGCGKTTLLNCLSGLDTVDAGRIVLEGKDLARLSDRKRTRHRGERVGFVFQSFHLVPVLSALQNVQLPLELRGMAKAEARQRSLEALDAVGVADQKDKLPLEMSGGQQQRVAIARALAHEPAVVFADEPTGNLDTHTGAEVLDLFQALNQEQGATFLVVTHDERVAARATRVVHMDSGAIVRDERRAAPASRKPAGRRPAA
ncbi:MAG TPA: ABC transporter ATP-binding protein [Candidatus Thermoplasmatota archaeon]|nr:ABC transporter ATP-binding protein [Candidatus Thermoplasmatota archaeon]